MSGPAAAISVALAAIVLTGAGCGDGPPDITSEPTAIPAMTTDRSAPFSTTTAPEAQDSHARPPAGRSESVPAVDLDGVDSGLGAEVGVAVGSPAAGEVAEGGSLRGGSAWSTIKVAIALAVLEPRGGPGGLSDAQQADIEAALTISDNAAAERLFASLATAGGGAESAAARVTGLLREVGDNRTGVSYVGRDGFSPFGQTDWSLKAQLRLVSALLAGCVADEESRDFVLEAMSNVGSDLWGLGSTGYPALWKGGWGPDADGAYVVRQIGAVKLRYGWVPVALAVRAPDGSFATGTAVASELATRVVDRLRKDHSMVPASC